MAAGDTQLGSLIMRLKSQFDGTGVKNAKQGFERMRRELDVQEESLSQAALGWAAFSTAVAAAFGVMIKGAVDFEESMGGALTLTRTRGEEFARMTDMMQRKALDLSDTLGMSANEISASFYNVLSTGTTATSAGFDNLAKVGLQLSKTIGLDAGTTIESLAAAAGAFRMEMSEVGSIADAFFTTSLLGQTTVPQLTEALKMAGPQAAGLGRP